MSELVLRFVLGGLIVSAFSVVGEAFKPKTFAGLFGAAPSVAMASLALAFAHHGSRYAVVEGRSMIAGALGFAVYGAACVAGAKDDRVPVWLAAVLAWFAWGASAFAIRALAAWLQLR